MKKTETEKMFGKFLCSDDVLKKYMDRKTFAKYLKTKETEGELDALVARKIAKAMKTWACENGATHYSHWFSPLTGKTAEKQVSFIEVDKNGKLVEDFSEKSLIKGEADASSFPNGGERVTFEARGYTVWDYTSPAFIKEDKVGNRTLYIPTAFCSYNGTALDEKTPLLRAIESLNRESLRVLKVLGYDDVKKVVCNVGAEQEYFLIKKKDFDKRSDLKVLGRTLVGAKPIKSQEINSHYFGVIDDGINSFMHDVDKELWKMGVMAKIQHNEVAPAQHELVPIFCPANIASDQNQVIMEVIKNVAKRHGFEALFHEKPFANMNGSGKHINWSLSTDTGINLIDSNIKDRRLFLLFFTSMIAGIDRYYKVVRASTAHRGNDLRLGGNEAPPTLVSMFVGENIEKILDSADMKVKNKTKYLETRVASLPKMKKDYCDRNRTSPFAYTGNKFEFRMVGSSQSIAWPSTCICTIVAKVLKEIADKLDKADNVMEAADKIVKENISNHRRIVFNGNGYDKEWAEEAAKRGLVEYKSCFDCLSVLDDKDVLDLFEETNVLDRGEVCLRKSTFAKAYAETVKIESLTMLELLHKDIYPSLYKFVGDLSNSIKLDADSKNGARSDMKEKILGALDKLYAKGEKLKSNLNVLDSEEDLLKRALFAKDNLAVELEEVRKIYDDIEAILPNYLEPFPTYNDILF